MDGLRRMLDRDWTALREDKLASWRARTPLERMEAGAALRSHVQRVRPDWPTPADRREDLEHHVRDRQLFSRLRERGL